MEALFAVVLIFIMCPISIINLVFGEANKNYNFKQRQIKNMKRNMSSGGFSVEQMTAALERYNKPKPCMEDWYKKQEYESKYDELRKKYCLGFYREGLFHRYNEKEFGLAWLLFQDGYVLYPDVTFENSVYSSDSWKKYKEDIDEINDFMRERGYENGNFNVLEFFQAKRNKNT